MSDFAYPYTWRWGDDIHVEIVSPKKAFVCHSGEFSLSRKFERYLINEAYEAQRKSCEAPND